MKAQRQRLRRLNLAILLAFVAVGVSLVYWAGVRAGGILARDDNPRLVEAELRIQRGEILDSQDRVLARSVAEGERFQRVYPLADMGPAVGYYSLRHGIAGIEQGLDPILRGETGDWRTLALRNVLHMPQVGQDVRLTLDADWQQAAETLLGDRRGAVLLFTLSDTAIRALVSHPTFDPNQLDEQFDALMADEDAPLLNRATQGRYQPGLALQPFILAGVVATDRLSLDNAVPDATVPVPVLDSILTCANQPEDVTHLADALRYGCPAPMLTVESVLQAAELQQIFADFGLTTAPELPLVTETSEATPPQDMRLAVLGQENLTVTPLQLGMAWMALANGGVLSQPRLVAAIAEGGPHGAWQTYTKLTPPREVVPSRVAAAILAALPRQKDTIEHVALALSGPGGSTNAWYLGLAPASDPRLAVVVIIEGSDDVGAAQEVGRALLTAAFGR